MYRHTDLDIDMDKDVDIAQVCVPYLYLDSGALLKGTDGLQSLRTPRNRTAAVR